MASTAQSLVTVEKDTARAQIAASRLAGLTNVELLIGDWREHLPSLRSICSSSTAAASQRRPMRSSSSSSAA